MPRKPATERAISSAACGGQTDRITSAWLDISLAVPTSRIPAAAARSAVAALRPADAHSTVSPRWLRQPPTAAPISPGCSTPIRFLSTIASGHKSRPCPRPGGVQSGHAFSMPGDARRPDLPSRPGPWPLTRGPRERCEAVSPLHAELDLVAGVAAAVRVLGRRSRHVGYDDQRAARGVRPQHVLDLLRVHSGDRPSAEDADDLPGARGELGEGQLAVQRVPGLRHGSGDDLRAVAGDEGAEPVDDVAGLPVHEVQALGVVLPLHRQPAVRLEAAARGGGVEQADVDAVAHPLLERQRAPVRGPGQHLAVASGVVGDRPATRPRPDPFGPGGEAEHFDRWAWTAAPA